MRTTTTLQDARLSKGPPFVSYLTRVQIKDSSGTWQTWTELDGQDMVKSVTWQDSLTQSMGSGEIVLATKYFEANANPYVDGTKWSGHLDVWREVKCEVAIVPADLDYEPVSADWVELFHARIDNYSVGNNGANTQIPLRDAMGAELMDTYIRSQEIQGGGSKDVEDVIQDLLNAWDPESRTLSFTATDFGVNEYNQTKEPLLRALRVLAQDTIGWDIRPLWRDSQWKLVLYEPRRDETSADTTLDADEYVSFDQFNSTLEHVRNAVRVVYGDEAVETDRSDPARSTVVATRTTSPANDLDGTPVADSSIDQYGLRFMELVEGASKLISSQSEAQNLADVAMSDLSQPILTTAVSLNRLYWQIEINDIVELAADDIHLSSNQNLAVNSYQHTLSPSKVQTSLTLQGAPKLARTRWLEVEAFPGRMSPPLLNEIELAGADIRAASGITAVGVTIPFPKRTAYNWDFIQMYRSTDPDFEPSADTLLGVSRSTYFMDAGLDPDTRYYYRTKMVDKSLNESAPSDPIAITPNAVQATQVQGIDGFEMSKSAEQLGETSPISVSFDSRVWGLLWYDISTDTFTAPEDGVYLIKYSTTVEEDSKNIAYFRVALDLYDSDGVEITTRYRVGNTVSLIQEPEKNTSSLTAMVPLNQGDQVRPSAYIDNAGSLIDVLPESSSFEVKQTLIKRNRTDAEWGGTRTFTTAGATGRTGPSQFEVGSEYTGTSLDGEVTVVNDGIQEWEVPHNGRYRITAQGAQGGTGTREGTGGTGASMQGNVDLLQGDKLYVLVGQKGLDNDVMPSGGGGSFVSKNDDSTPLIVAGGGGGYGVGDTDFSSAPNASLNPDGKDGETGSGSFGAGGEDGLGGGAANSRGAGGGGFLGAGEDATTTDSGGQAFTRLDGLGGDGNGISDGGFGGGGAVDQSTGFGACGGGGGYGGGGGAYSGSSADEGAGGGGGSYNIGKAQTNELGVDGDGYVTVELVSANPPPDIFEFTTAGSTGRIGPTSTDIENEYDKPGAALYNRVSPHGFGLQEFEVTSTGKYRIEAAGAQGGTAGSNGWPGGRGAVMRGDFELTAGEVLRTAVGQEGLDGISGGGSGGGGSMVRKISPVNELLILAGGGGGQLDTTEDDGNPHATITNTGDQGGVGNAGSGGGGGGAGWASDGGDGGASTSVGGTRFINSNGPIGGLGDSVNGGWGGGGAKDGTFNDAGGGGGYSGGDSGYYARDNDTSSGGGSYNTGRNQDNSAGSVDGNEGDGWVTISKI